MGKENTDQLSIRRSDFDRIILEALRPTDRLLTITEAAKRLRCSLPTLSKIRKSGNLKETRVLSKIYIKESDLQNFLDQEKKEVVND